jgi:hypothetical protein
MVAADALIMPTLPEPYLALEVCLVGLNTPGL